MNGERGEGDKGVWGDKGDKETRERDLSVRTQLGMKTVVRLENYER